MTPSVTSVQRPVAGDGHDASINIMRRVLQAEGAEVIHLGHDRSVQDIVDAAVQEDAHGIAVSSYQGGHVEFFTYMVELLRARGRGDIPVFGGGGGTITDKEIALLHERGVARLYSVEDGRHMGLVGMIRDMLTRARRELTSGFAGLSEGFRARNPAEVARVITALETFNARGSEGDAAAETQLATMRAALRGVAPRVAAPVLGITGMGGAGKSSLTDEMVRRLLATYATRTMAVLSVDPSKRRTGGALLGDRIRMNAIATSDPQGSQRVFMRSFATRAANTATSAALLRAIDICKIAGFDLVIVETAGIGQSDSAITDLVDVSMYVMTPEFGAASQLEKIDMLDFADVVAINKADKRGAADARAYVAKQVQRNRGQFQAPLGDMPVFTCMASRFGDAGVDALFAHLMQVVQSRDPRPGFVWDAVPPPDRASDLQVVVPPQRVRYLSEIAESIRGYHTKGGEMACKAARADGLRRTLIELGDTPPEALAAPYADPSVGAASPEIALLRARYNAVLAEMTPAETARCWPTSRVAGSLPSGEARHPSAGPRDRHRALHRVALGHARAQGGAAGIQGPRRHSPLGAPGKRARELPYAGGVFPFKRENEDPTRMFAGEGSPERTNRRFHLRL